MRGRDGRGLAAASLQFDDADGEPVAVEDEIEATTRVEVADSDLARGDPVVVGGLRVDNPHGGVLFRAIGRRPRNPAVAVDHELVHPKCLSGGVLRGGREDLGDGLIELGGRHLGVEPRDGLAEVDGQDEVRGRCASVVEVSPLHRTPAQLAQVVVGDEFQVFLGHGHSLPVARASGAAPHENGPYRAGTPAPSPRPCTLTP